MATLRFMSQDDIGSSSNETVKLSISIFCMRTVLVGKRGENSWDE